MFSAVSLLSCVENCDDPCRALVGARIHFAISTRNVSASPMCSAVRFQIESSSEILGDYMKIFR